MKIFGTLARDDGTFVLEVVPDWQPPRELLPWSAPIGIMIAAFLAIPLIGREAMMPGMMAIGIAAVALVLKGLLWLGRRPMGSEAEKHLAMLLTEPERLRRMTREGKGEGEFGGFRVRFSHFIAMGFAIGNCRVLEVEFQPREPGERLTAALILDALKMPAQAGIPA